jgi:sulfur carrier protein
MNIYINNKQEHLGAGVNIAEMLDSIRCTDTKGIAIALNEVVVPRNIWSSTILNEHDQILIIKATPGG